MTEAMPFLQKYDITFLRPLPIWDRAFFHNLFPAPLRPVCQIVMTGTVGPSATAARLAPQPFGASFSVGSSFFR